MKNLISIDQFSADELINVIIPGCEKMIAMANKMQSGKYKLPDFRERKLTIFSFEPSTRTIDSYMEASGLLGWSDHRVPMPDNTSLKKGESWAETAREWGNQGAGVIAMRTTIEGVQTFLAEILERDGYNISVQNCGDGEHEHPSQTILDLVTIKREKGRLDNLTIGFLGDLHFGRTVHSLIKALSLFEGISLRLVSTPEMSLPENYLENFKGEVKKGHKLELLSDCDVVYATRIQTERLPPELKNVFEKAREEYYITTKVLDIFKPDVIVMHPRPHNDGFSPEAITDKRVVMNKQSRYGIPTRMYLLDRGYNNRCRKESPAKNLPRGKMKTILLKNLQVHLKDSFQKKRSGQKTHRYFYPIDNGTVIDHLPQDFGPKIRNVLEKAGVFTEDSVITTSEDVPSKSMGKKDVLVLEKAFLKEELMISIASFAEGVTFNVIKNGRLRKMALEKAGAIKKIGKCPNLNCITNNDPEAFPVFIAMGNSKVKCYYCGRSFKNHEVIKKS